MALHKHWFIVVLALLGGLSLRVSCQAAETEQAPLNFDTQLIRIFEVSQTAPQFSEEHSVSTDERKVLARILDKLRSHKMTLKNIVYRTDMNVIRITWGDDVNDDVVKVAYKTGKDPVLGNSVYADKRQVIDVKIMYKKGPSAYDYLHINNMDNLKRSFANMGDAPAKLPSRPTFNYAVEGKVTNEECRFCHILAENDGSPKGIFYPRYQEENNGHDLGNVDSLFHSGHFQTVSAASAAQNGLPKMSEDFLFQKVAVAVPNMLPEDIRFARVMIELPQLLEVMARDNGKSMCVLVSFPVMDMNLHSENNNYVCADNVTRQLMVKLTNAALSSNHGPNEYSEPYYEKK